MLSAIIAIFGGLTAASSLIVVKKLNAKELLGQLTPYQGCIGILVFFYGINNLRVIISNMGTVEDYFIIWLIELIMSLVMLIVGFLLVYSLISKYLLEKNRDAKRRGRALRAQLTMFQIPAGFILTVLGLLYIVL